MLDLGTLEAKIKLDGAEDFKKDLKGSSDAAEEASTGLKGKLFSAANIAKAGLIALGVAAVAALTKITKASINAYKDTEQLQGGVKKLFGENSAKIVEANAQKAFATMGISANQYMETVTSFSASLLQSLGGDTEAAANKADMAMQDMADNASIFGTDMQSIQNAYQGFAKQNYTMLDNLKLGYGGTKSEMERLLADAGKLTGQKYDINNLSDVYDAIHAIQVEQGIAGNAAAEASKTIEGSINATKAAWQNLLSGLADPKADVGKLVANLVDSAMNVLNNLMPVIARILLKVVDALPQLYGALMNGFKQLIDRLMAGMPQFSQKIGQSIANLFIFALKNLPQLLLTALDFAGILIMGILNAIGAALGVLIKAGAQLIGGIITGIRGAIGKVWAFFAAIPKRLIAFLASGAKGFVTKGGQFISGLLQGIKNKWGALKAWVASIPSKIKAALGNLGRLLFGAGKDIMDGLKEGISQKWEDIKSSVSKMGEWIKAHKGPKEYDLKLLVPNGNWIMEGLNTGIEQGRNTLKKTLSGIANDISATPFEATASLAYASDGAPVSSDESTTYNLYINGARINDDSQIRANFLGLLNEMARKGMM